MFAVIRIRGAAGNSKRVEDTLKMIRLIAVNNCVLIPESVDYKGMLEKAKDTITWGEIEKDTLVKMLEKRLKSKNNEKISEKELKSIAGYDYEGFADALLKGKIKLKDLEKLQPVFRLTPASKGLKSVKEHYPKGDLGYRGKEINELIEKMI